MGRAAELAVWPLLRWLSGSSLFGWSIRSDTPRKAWINFTIRGVRLSTTMLQRPPLIQGAGDLPSRCWSLLLCYWITPSASKQHAQLGNSDALSSPAAQAAKTIPPLAHQQSRARSVFSVQPSSYCRTKNEERSPRCWVRSEPVALRAEGRLPSPSPSPPPPLPGDRHWSGFPCCS